METIIQKPKTTPMDFFLQIGAILTLYFLIINIIQLLFQTIDVAYPKTLDSVGHLPDISFQMSALIVGFPIYILLIFISLRNEKLDITKKDLPVRKWLAYLTLFIAGVAIAVDLIYLLTAFLRGDEITLGFMLKILTILVIAITIFGYYISELRFKNIATVRKYIGLGAGIIVIGSIAFGFSVFGSPATQKAIKYDMNRIEDLKYIQFYIVKYWEAKETVPSEQVDLNDSLTGVSVPKDPRSGADYTFEIISKLSFKLCANFERASTHNSVTPQFNRIESLPISAPEFSGKDFRQFVGEEYWNHDEGFVCFERTIDPSYFQK